MFHPPFDREFTVTQDFGGNAHLYAPYGLKGHNGIDHATPVGTPVRAMHTGTVKFGGDGSAYAVMGASAGTCILIEDESGTFATGYAHLMRTYVHAGDKIQAGAVIGISGNTGASTGPHTHVEFLPLPLQLDNGYLGRAPFPEDTPGAVEDTPATSEETPADDSPAPDEEGPANVPDRKPATRTRKPRTKAVKADG